MVLSTKEFVEKYGLMAKKTLGQNFLLDANITDKIMRLSLKEQNISDLSDDKYIEVSAASIIAKAERDAHISEINKDYIKISFEQNNGQTVFIVVGSVVVGLLLTGLVVVLVKKKKKGS